MIDQEPPLQPKPDNAALDSFLKGFRVTAGLAVAGGVFGFLFGVLALSRGLDAGSTVIMSAAVFSGSAQVAILELWHRPLPYLGLFLAAALVCSRHILMGVTLHASLARRRPPFAVLFVLTDANWVLTMRETAARNRLAFFAGSGFAMYSAWVIGTVLGVLAPGVLAEQTIAGLSVGGALYLAILLTIYFQGKLPVKFVAPAASAMVTMVVNRYQDASLAILAGVSAAALITYVLERRRA